MKTTHPNEGNNDTKVFFPKETEPTVSVCFCTLFPVVATQRRSSLLSDHSPTRKRRAHLGGRIYMWQRDTRRQSVWTGSERTRGRADDLL